MLDINIQINQGNFKFDIKLEINDLATAIFGASGTGKTSILNSISGLIKPKFGKIVLDNKTIYDSKKNINLPPNKRNIGYVFQDNQLFPHLSVKSNLLYGYKILDKNKIRFEPEQIISLLEISNLLSRYPKNLSGGEKQRVAIGRAILCSPNLLLFDEPMSSLDEGLKKQILPFLRKVILETKIPILYVSHSLSEILQLTSKIIILEKGKIIGHSDFFEIIKDEKALNISKSSGLDNVIEVDVIKCDEDLKFTIAKIANQELKLPFSNFLEGQKVFVSIKPEEIVLANNKIDGVSIQNQIKGKIVDILKSSDSILVKINIGTIILAEISFNALHNLSLKQGKEIYCLIKTNSFTFLSSI